MEIVLSQGTMKKLRILVVPKQDTTLDTGEKLDPRIPRKDSLHINQG
jgi:hypothetical protein